MLQPRIARVNKKTFYNYNYRVKKIALINGNSIESLSKNNNKESSLDKILLIIKSYLANF